MARYARISGKLQQETIDALLDDLKLSLTDGSYLLVLPQFLVTGTA